MYNYVHEVASSQEEGLIRLSALVKSLAVLNRALPLLSFEKEIHDLVENDKAKLVTFEDETLSSFMAARLGLEARLVDADLDYNSLCETMEGSFTTLQEQDESWDIEKDFVKALGTDISDGFWAKQVLACVPTQEKPAITMLQAQRNSADCPPMLALFQP